MSKAAGPQLTEDETDDLLYLARAGEVEEFMTLQDEVTKRENCKLCDVLGVVTDEYTGNGPLHMAAANGHASILSKILEVLAQPSPQNPAQLERINAQNEAGNTALHYAALNGHLDAVKVLIDAGADPTITNKAGHDPVYEAELNDKNEVVEWVLKESEGLEQGIAGDGDDDAEEPEDEAESSEGKGKGTDLMTEVKKVVEDVGKLDIQKSNADSS